MKPRLFPSGCVALDVNSLAIHSSCALPGEKIHRFHLGRHGSGLVLLDEMQRFQLVIRVIDQEILAGLTMAKYLSPVALAYLEASRFWLHGTAPEWDISLHFLISSPGSLYDAVRALGLVRIDSTGDGVALGFRFKDSRSSVARLAVCVAA